MYLSRLEIKGFRCLRDLTVAFQPGINVILGENNVGKTALLDALRLVLSLGSDRRDIYITEDDLWHDDSGQRAQSCVIDATFAGLTLEEAGGLSTCLSPSCGEGVAQVHIRAEPVEHRGRRRLRVSFWGGEKRGDSIPSDALVGLRVVYLEALRDVRVGLRPGRMSRIASLLQLLARDESERNRLVSIVEKANTSIEKDELVRDVQQKINERLKDAVGPLLAQQADLRLSPPDFRRITESLRPLVGRRQPFELEENGLGYNNLLYIAVVMVEMQVAKVAEEVDLAALLIEEPEAHLHPQLQTLLVDYLQAVSTGEGETGRSVPPVQVFVTTHSPTFASRMDLDSLIVLYEPVTRGTRAFPVSAAALSGDEKRRLRRYLDVTRAQLFFAKGLILVEGISEALLLPELARRMGCRLEHHGVSIVNVQSLSFAPFARLFKDRCFEVPVALVSDSDPPPAGADTFGHSTGTSRQAAALKRLEGGTLKVYLASRTFEYDLARAGNAARMAEAYSQMHPDKGSELLSRLSGTSDPVEQADVFWSFFDSHNGRHDKAEFAQRLADLLSRDGAGFQVPKYLQDAIRLVTQAGHSGG